MTSERESSGLGADGRFEGSRGGSGTDVFEIDGSDTGSTSRLRETGSWVEVTGTRRGPKGSGRFDSPSGREGCD